MPKRIIAKTVKEWIRPLCIPLIRSVMRRAAQGRFDAPGVSGFIFSLVQGARFNFETTTTAGFRMAGNTRDLIQRCIYWFGVWEPDLSGFIGERLSAGDTFVDVGANIGYFSLYASQLVGANGHVVAIEASPGIYRQLHDNVALNRAANVRLVNCAAADRRQKLRLFRAPDSNSGQSSVIPGDGFSLECDIDALPLDDILTGEEFSRARMVKIDVEGAEWLVISGMHTILSASRHELEIVVEINPAALARHGRTVADAFALFAAHGFHPYRLENDYSPARYLRAHRRSRPQRIREGLSEQTDVVFSRIDGDAL